MRKNFYKLQVVKTRKNHECIVCGENIAQGSRTLVENGFNRNEGFFSHYFHIDKEHACYLDYLDCVQPNDLTIKDKLENSEFFGELIWRTYKEN